MVKRNTNSKYVLILIGSLFSIIGIALFVLLVWITPSVNNNAANTDFEGVYVGIILLAITTFTISGFIWWIVFSKKWLNTASGS